MHRTWNLRTSTGEMHTQWPWHNIQHFLALQMLPDGTEASKYYCENHCQWTAWVLTPVSSKDTQVLSFLCCTLKPSATHPGTMSSPSGHDVQPMVCSCPSDPSGQGGCMRWLRCVPSPSHRSSGGPAADSPGHLQICPNQHIYTYFMTYPCLNKLINSTNTFCIHNDWFW